ncbi:hypothetical protein V8G54_013911 [Vigna mungo]|uniref:RRM domain-containing protein n=1 Tax=Vigna mungo TaxID=3915 RepID=A0AAQ3NI26_VIGMU
MAQQVLLSSCSPQYVSLRRVRISKPSIWVTKPTTVSSPSFSTSAPLRHALFRCSSSATSSVEPDLSSSAKIFVKDFMQLKGTYIVVVQVSNLKFPGIIVQTIIWKHLLLILGNVSSKVSLPPKLKFSWWAIAGLPHSTSEGRLMKVFSEFGVVNLVQLPIDEKSGKSLGFAFIWFVKEESAQLAVQEMNGKSLSITQKYTWKVADQEQEAVQATNGWGPGFYLLSSSTSFDHCHDHIQGCK